MCEKTVCISSSYSVTSSYLGLRSGILFLAKENYIEASQAKDEKETTFFQDYLCFLELY